MDDGWGVARAIRSNVDVLRRDRDRLHQGSSDSAAVDIVDIVSSDDDDGGGGRGAAAPSEGFSRKKRRKRTLESLQAVSDSAASMDTFRAEREAGRAAVRELKAQLGEVRAREELRSREVAELTNALAAATEKQKEYEKAVLRLSQDDEGEAIELNLSSVSSPAAENEKQKSVVVAYAEACVKLRSLQRHVRQMRMEGDDDRRGGSRRLDEMALELDRAKRAERNATGKLESAKSRLAKCRELEIRIKDLEGELVRSKGRCDELLACETERDALLAERKEWEARFTSFMPDIARRLKQSGTAFTPLEVLRYVRELKMKQQQRLAVKAKEKSIAERQTSDHGKLMQALRSAEVARDEAQVATAKCESKLQLAHARCAHLDRERKSLMRVIDSMAKENPAIVKAERDSGARSRAEPLDVALTKANERIKTLEAKLQRLNSKSPMVANAERRMVEATKQRLREADSKCSQLQLKLDEANMRLAQCSTEKPDLREHQDDSVVILHFANNPAHTAIEARKAAAEKSKDEIIEQLKSENAKLKELQHSGSNFATPVPPSSARSSSRADENKRMDRLKALFKKKISSFKEAVYLLTGFKVDMTTDEKRPQLRIRSMYAEQEDDSLLFRWPREGGGGLELLETDFCSRIDESDFAYLRRCNSVPAFLSTITLSLFENQTLMQ